MDAAVVEGQVFHRAFAISKKTYIIVVLIERHMADGVSVAVESAAERRTTVCADACIGLSTIVKVGFQAEKLAALAVAAIDARRQAVHLVGVADDVGVFFRAASGVEDGESFGGLSGKVAHACNGDIVVAGYDATAIGQGHGVVRALF